MNRTVSLILAVLLAVLVPAVRQAYGDASTIDGIVSDTKCGRSHKWSGKTDVQCVQDCLKGKNTYALVVGDKVYTLAGQEKTIAPFACQHVQIKGTIEALRLTVISIHEMR